MVARGRRVGQRGPASTEPVAELKGRKSWTGDAGRAGAHAAELALKDGGVNAGVGAAQVIQRVPNQAGGDKTHKVAGVGIAIRRYRALVAPSQGAALAAGGLVAGGRGRAALATARSQQRRRTR